jgi:hypothetical protein
MPEMTDALLTLILGTMWGKMMHDSDDFVSTALGIFLMVAIFLACLFLRSLNN